MITRPLLIVQNIPEDGPGILENLLRSQQLPYTICPSHELPQTIDAYAALIILGGPQSATDTTPEIVQEKRLILQALSQRRPMLGICLGGQLLASVCGAPILSGSATEIGFSSVNLTDAGKTDPLFTAWTESTHLVFQWHHDQFTLPEAALLLEQGNNGAAQAFRIGPCAYGTQFHPELTEQMLHLWLQSHPEREKARTWIGEEAYKHLYEEHTDDYARYRVESTRLFHNFLRLVNLLEEEEYK